MNIKRQIKQKFKFLKENGFRRKVFSHLTDYEISYKKGDIVVEILYSLSVNTDFKITKEMSVNELLENSFYCVEVIIQTKNGVENILRSSLFDDQKIQELKSLISANKGFPEEQIEIYSKFLNDNLLRLEVLS